MKALGVERKKKVETFAIFFCLSHTHHRVKRVSPSLCLTSPRYRKHKIIFFSSVSPILCQQQNHKTQIRIYGKLATTALFYKREIGGEEKNDDAGCKIKNNGAVPVNLGNGCPQHFWLTIKLCNI